MSKVRQLPLDRLDGLDLLPLACLKDAVARIGDANGIRFVHEHDDLDEYEVAALEFDAATASGMRPVVFALRAYRGAPGGVIDVLLPAGLLGSGVLRLLAVEITHALQVPPERLVWPEGIAPPAKQPGDARRRVS